jgi:Tol biopolymer transport system component
VLDFVPFGWPAVSPDGRTLGLFGDIRTENASGGGEWRHTVALVPTDGGELRVILSSESAGWALSGWSADGAHVFTSTGEGSDRTRIRIDVATGDVTPIPNEIDLTDAAPPILRVHPSGSRVAFRKGTSKGEIWMMTGFGND